LLKRYEADVVRQLWRFSRDRTACEELVQEVFVETYLSLPRYRPRKVPFLHWLRRITTRVGYRYWKRQSRRRLHLSLDNVDPPAPPTRDPSAAAELLHGLLARLGTADRLVLTLMYFEDCTVDQIAARTGWNRAMVKMRAHRARRKLRTIIEREKLIDTLREITDGNA
jgi:RNA polymerase sigma-70 factor (ECF subfamily)